jgi:hypothetical protein
MIAMIAAVAITVTVALAATAVVPLATTYFLIAVTVSAYVPSLLSIVWGSFSLLSILGVRYTRT